jgi:hypothetical protein
MTKAVFTSFDCPGNEFWRALAADSALPQERARFEQHLGSCAACRQRLDQPDALSEPLLATARQVGDPTAAPIDPTLVQVLERLHETRSPMRAVPEESADLYFLRPSEDPHVLGMLGDYEVQEVIGQGGMGVVLKAFEPALHRLVAIKVMAAAVAGSVTARQRFTREARAAAAVCHEHVVPVHGVHEQDGLPYLVMQYVAGESLQERLDRAGPLELPEIVRIGLQTASGLAAAHAQGLIHRDIKPANLLLENGLAKVKITDFGLARTTDEVGLTQNGVVAGTPEYMAPEQAAAQPIDHRADLFSLGSVLYAMCAGRPPFRGATAMAVLFQVGHETPTPLRAINPDVPVWLESLVQRLLAKDPADRIQSAAEVASLLEGYLAHLRQPLTVPAPSLPPSANGARIAGASGAVIFRRFAWAVALGLLAAVGFGTTLTVHGLIRAGGGAVPVKQPAKDVAAAPEATVDENVWALAFSPDSKRLVTAGGRRTSPGQLQIWDVGTRKPLVTRRASPGVRSVAFSPDGLILATGHWEGDIKLRDPVTGKPLKTLAGHDSGANALAFSADNTLLASAGLDKTVKLWDVPAGTERREFTGHDGMVLSVAFFHNRRAVVSGSWDRTARIWDLDAGVQRLALRTHRHVVEAVAVSPDDKVLATGSWDQTIKLWDAETGKETGMLRQNGGNVQALAFSPDGRLLASAGSDGRLRVWDVPLRNPLLDVPRHQGLAWTVAFSPDGKLLATGGTDKTAQLFDVAAWQDLATLSTADGEAIPDVPETSDAPVAADADGSPAKGARTWLWAAALAGLLLMSSLLVIWLVQRRRRPARSLADAEPAPAIGVTAPAPARSGPSKRSRLGRGMRRRHVIAAMVFLMGVGLGVWFVPWMSGGGVLKQAPPGNEIEKQPEPASAELRKLLARDFRGRPLPSDLTPFDPLTDHFIKAEAQGLRITLPRDRTTMDSGGLSMAVAVGGDFEITTGVEILNADVPGSPRRYGVGVLMSLNEKVRIGRLVRAQGQQVITWDRWATIDGGQRFLCGAAPGTGNVGRLCFKRSNNVVHFLWAPGLEGDKFEEVHQCVLDIPEVTEIRWELSSAVDEGRSGALDVRLLDLTIRSSTAPAEPVVAADEEPAARSNEWLLAAAIAAAMVVLIALVTSLFVHHRRRARAPLNNAGAATAANVEAAPTPVVFACSGCGRRLKARAALAGKKTKCPQCGQVMVVPADLT